MRASALLRPRALCFLAALLAFAATTYAQTPAISAGSQHTCALRADSTVACWGRGQLGNGITSERQTTPVVVQEVGGGGPLRGAKAIAAGGYHTCALVTGGAVVCWGDGSMGQRGDGMMDGAGGTPYGGATPVAVRADGGGTLSNVIAITAGGQHTCALRGGGTVVCWGSGSYGQLGHGSKPFARPTPVVVQSVSGTGPLSGVVALAAGGFHTCAVQEGGGVACWGTGTALGNGRAFDEYATPVAVQAVGGGGTLSGAVSIVSRNAHTCAVRAGGTAVCWGSNYSGEAGDGQTGVVYQWTPVVVRDPDGAGAPLNVAAMAVGGGHTCAINAGATVLCWGFGLDGERGDGTTTRSQPTPVAVQAIGGGGALADVTAIASGLYHTCALLADGSAACWGRGSEGQLGNGTTTPVQTTPVLVSGGRFVPAEEPAVSNGEARLAIHPNPARTAATATLALPTAGHARVSLHDALGREVALVFDGHAQAAQPLALDVSGLAPGVYVMRAVAGRTAITRTLVVAR